VVVILDKSIGGSNVIAVMILFSMKWFFGVESTLMVFEVKELWIVSVVGFGEIAKAEIESSTPTLLVMLDWVL
jgi:hypothetical protein